MYLSGEGGAIFQHGNIFKRFITQQKQYNIRKDDCLFIEICSRFFSPPPHIPSTNEGEADAAGSLHSLPTNLYDLCSSFKRLSSQRCSVANLNRRRGQRLILSTLLALQILTKFANFLVIVSSY